MKQITLFTTGFLIALSIAIIASLPESEVYPATLQSHRVDEVIEKGYFIESIDGGYCADRLVRARLTYTATYCNGEFGPMHINFPHTDNLEWDAVYQAMMNEVDSLRARYYPDFWRYK